MIEAALTTWWAWLVAAGVLGAVEVVLPVFAFLGFAAGAAATGLLLLAGLDLGTGWTLLVFAALSAVAYGLLRWLLREQGGQTRIVTRDVNEN